MSWPLCNLNALIPLFLATLCSAAKSWPNGFRPSTPCTRTCQLSFASSWTAARDLFSRRPGAIFALAQDGRLELPGDLLETFKGIVKTPLLWSDYVRDPGNTEAALVQMQFELLLLALCGLVKFHDGRVLPQTYPLACQEKPSALLVLETLDPEMDLSSVEPLLPQGPRHSMLNLTHALAVAALLRKFMDGSEEATLEAQSCCDALFFCPSLSTSCVHVWSFLKRLLTNCPIPLLCPLLQARREAFEWSQTNSKPF